VVILGHTLSYNSLLLAGIFWATVIIAVMDWETRLVSEKMIVIWGFLVLTMQFASPLLCKMSNVKCQMSNQIQISNFQIQNNFMGLLVAVGLIGGIWAVSRGKAMGFGDVEISAVMGWWLGWPRIAPALWISFVSGALVGLWLMVHRKMKMKSEVAFGPFLILGCWVANLWGDKIWTWVFRF
jgi:leader peptidase (prepilin peptidase)/N-methyltransferase